MDEFYFRKSHVPAFGSWDCNGEYPPFTQCFESANQAARMFRYSYSQDRDLYVAGDLYDNDVVTPAVIVVPRRRRNTGKGGFDKEKENESWVVCECEPVSPTPRRRVTPKAVDEDLYKISPDLLRAQPKRESYSKLNGFSVYSLQRPHGLRDVRDEENMGFLLKLLATITRLLKSESP